MALRLRILAVPVAAFLLAACSSTPVSQAGLAPTDTPPAGSALPAPSAAPGTPQPSAAPATSAPATPEVTIDGPPPKPGTPTFKLVSEEPGTAPGLTTETYQVTWTEPEGAAGSFLVYGLKVCLRDSAKYDGKPCVVKGMKIPTKQLDLLGTAPGDARSINVSWQLGEAGPGPYWAILLRATNASGNSIFTIVHTEDVCFGCTY
jgi:hypothetical protein